jgi:replicative DNA helicase
MESAVQNQPTRLPFSEIKQRALLGHLIENSSFFKQAKTQIQADWFLDEHVVKVVRAMFKYYEDYKRIPTIAEIKAAPSILKEDVKIQKRCHFLIDLVLVEKANFHIDPLVNELTDWLKTRHYSKYAAISSKLFNQERYEQAYVEMKKMIRELDAIDFENDQEKSFEDYMQQFENNKKQNLEGGLTFGLTMMDRLLLPEGTSGGLLPGDTTLLLAPTNIGKTTTMITIIRHNLEKGKDVLFLTHEGREEDIMDKLWCSILGVNKATLYDICSDTKRMEEGLKKFKAHLTYVPYNKAGATIEDVETLIRRKQEQRIAKHGKGYDLVVDDYPSKLSTVQAKQGNFQPRHIETHVYNTFVQLALEYKFHCLCAIQTNRTGSKKNRGFKNKWEDEGESSRLLTMEDVAESWGPMTIATNVISINRDERAVANNRVTFYICKSRSSETGFAVLCESKYSQATTHDDKLGHTSMRTSHSMSEQAARLLKEFNGKMVPDYKLLAAASPANAGLGLPADKPYTPAIDDPIQAAKSGITQ